MYEVWLALNILWEMALDVWPILLVAVVLWLLLMVVSLRRPARRWRASFGVALAVGLAVALAALLTIPGWTLSSLGEMGYWVDWANLAAIALGFGVVALAFAWPLLAARGRAA